MKYFSENDHDHLLDTLKKHYKLHIDKRGSHYMGLTLNGNYKKEQVNISMPKYIKKALHKLGHENPDKPEYSPHEHQKVKNTKRGEQQLTPNPDRNKN